MDYQKLAQEVIREVGGKENIHSLTHCVTRLRFVLNEVDKADTEAVKKINGVLGVTVSGGQYQVIIGTEVKKAYQEVEQLLGLAGEDEAPADSESMPEKKGSIFNRFFKAIAGMILPLLGPLTAAGITKGLLAACTSFGILQTTDGTYQILYAFADGFFYFLPIILGISAARYFKSNPYVAAAIGTALVYPGIVQAFTDGTSLSFLHIPVVLSNYTSSIFPIMLATFFAAKLEHFIEPRLPESITKFITPLFVLLITVPLTFLVIGPIMMGLSDILAAGVMGLYNLSPIIAGIILGAFWQVIVITGLHYAFIPILMNNITTMGHDPINAILNVTIFALSGAAIGFALRAKKKENKALGFSTGVTGLLGITEPIIYGVALPYRRPFICAFIGGGIGGGITAAMGASMYSFGANGIFAAPMFINPAGIDSSFTAYLISSTVAFGVSLILTYFFGIKKGQEA
ncbi:PTS transporter subunit EIIC [Listeria costaricensis]|uniref:PTS transporter subunit EIIC n=1 Tax=Listeria costaricensis TaxID=2026604 RepID=UPI000C084DAF|nr:PTS transporter subunit EIIC [Listeria costaricensis]